MGLGLPVTALLPGWGSGMSPGYEALPCSPPEHLTPPDTPGAFQHTFTFSSYIYTWYQIATLFSPIRGKYSL